MRNFLLGLLGVVVLATLSAPNAALARWYDYPNSGRCPGSLIRVTNLRVCARFDHNGHRISNTALVPKKEFDRYGVSRLQVQRGVPPPRPPPRERGRSSPCSQSVLSPAARP
jgi:hypothetical protein